ncbi:39S ribosomal protein L15, mitochondrial [Aplysia californica]|uniref:Large ribosomal subunit protein uL15m n=1 Tax=Aplysia californica TaxID=6500 RepID=A0ABM0JNE0_APLCA|nr:39S ribosomal protein L15, mitochondrial [Aplysia californica]
MASKVTERALSLIKSLPRVALTNIKDLPSAKRKKTGKPAGQKKKGRGDKGQGARNTWDPLGYEGGQSPLINNVPLERYYGKYALRRQYPPISLLELQRLIDLNRVDISRPVDVTAICNSRLYSLDVAKNHFGFHLTEEGCDSFDAKINLEVQWTSELVIAAVEKSGGTITTRYYDPQSLGAVFDPQTFFQKGLPIPKCKLPPQDALAYYSDPNARGYLADPEKILEARERLAQKYGYKLPDLSSDPVKDLLLMRKDPLQLFYGLEPGWIVNLRDKCVLKPQDEDYRRYYNTVY